MTTFSQLVDLIARETRRLDMLDEIATYVNQTIREMHASPENGAMLKFVDNYCELRLVATVDEGFTWTLPYPHRFGGMAAVRYTSVWQNGLNPYAREHLPSRKFETVPFAWYRARDQILFKGYGGVNALIDVAWYEYPPALQYFAPNCRPAEFTDLGGFSYGESWVHDHDREQARLLTSNWILLRWPSVVTEGVRAKVYKRLADEVRARTSYSMYAQLRQGFIIAETVRDEGVNFDDN